MGNRLSSEYGCYPWDALPALKCGEEVGSGAQGYVTLATYDTDCKDKYSDSTRNIAVKVSRKASDNPGLEAAALNEIAVMKLFDGSALVTRIWDSQVGTDAVYILEEGIA